MGIQKKKVAVRHLASESDLASESKRRMPSLTVVARKQTADEQHRFNTAIDALLTEMVRQQMGRRS